MRVLASIITTITFFLSNAHAQTTSFSDSLHQHQYPEFDSLGWSFKHAPEYIIAKRSLDWLDYNSLGYSLKYIPGVSVQEVGTYGHPIVLSFSGSRPNYVSLQRGSENMNDLIFGIPDHNFIPIEASDSIVVSSQHQAFYTGGNGKLFSTNVIEKEFDSPRPYSRIRHIEAPYDLSYTDALFSMNTTTDANLTVGIVRQSLGTSATSFTSLDTRLPNSGYGSWNLRGSYHINISPVQRISVKDHYDHFIVMNNGGVSPFSQSIYYADSAFGLIPTLVNTAMQTEVVRNRIESDYRFQLFSDSLHRSKVNISYTSNVYRFLDRMDLSRDSLDRLNTKSVWDQAEIHVQHQSAFDVFSLDAGGSLNRYQIRGSPYVSGRSGLNSALYGKLSLLLGRFSTDFLIREENKFGRATIGLGATARTQITSDFFFWCGVSFSGRSPNLFETSWLSDRVLRYRDEFKNEDITVAEAGIHFQSQVIEFDLRSFYRTVRNPIEAVIDYSVEANYSRLMTTLYSNVNSALHVDDAGVNLLFRLNAWKFLLESRTGFVKTISSETRQRVTQSQFFGNAELYFRDEFIEKVLDVKAGLLCKFSTAYYPYAFNPETGTYGFSSLSPDASTLSKFYAEYVVFDAYLFAHIKTAALHFILENIFDTRYITTTFYPMSGRAFRFSVTWAFLD